MENLTIKRYGNRKYYLNGTYTTLSNILSLLQGGKRFTVIEHQSNKDVTLETIGKALAVNENSNLEPLKDLIFNYTTTLVQPTENEDIPLVQNVG